MGQRSMAVVFVLTWFSTAVAAGTTGDSASLAREALERYERREPVLARRVTRRLLQGDPDNPTGLLVAAMLADDEGLARRAVELYRRVLHVPATRGRAAARLAEHVLAAGRMAEATGLVALAEADVPELAATHAARAEILAAENRYVEAVTAIERALARSPDDAGALVRKFNYLLRLQDYDAAAATIDDVRRRAPELSTLPFLEGRLHHARGEVEAAIENLTAYVLRPAPPDRGTVWALGAIGAMRERQGRYAEALDSIEKALRLAPGDGDLTAQLATLREKRRLAALGTTTVLGSCVIHHLADCPQAQLDGVAALFDRAWRRIGPLYGVESSDVHVSILRNTPARRPAMYDMVSDEIVIAADCVGRDGVPSESAKRLVLHEVSHLGLQRAAGRKVFRLANLWMIEGLAEYHAGMGAVCSMDGEPLTLARLGNYLAVGSTGEDSVRRKAYAQACAMVAEVCRRHPGDACRRLVRTMQAVADNVPLDEAFIRNLGVTAEELVAMAGRSSR